MLCEHCESIHSLETFVEHKAKEVARNNVSELLGEAEQAVEQAKLYENKSIAQSPDHKEKVLMGIVMVSCVFIAFQIFSSLGSNSSLSAEEILAEERSRDQIESCMLVFWEIAAQLANGIDPDDSLRCSDSGLPMIVATVDGDLRISHPRPELLGLTDIYVTRSNPIPILVE